MGAPQVAAYPVVRTDRPWGKHSTASDLHPGVTNLTHTSGDHRQGNHRPPARPLAIPDRRSPNNEKQAPPFRRRMLYKVRRTFAPSQWGL
jgi:hypothetical protein